jgi:hypothetical protein
VHARQLILPCSATRCFEFINQITAIHFDNHHGSSRAAMYAERDGPAPALLLHDRGVADRYDGGYQQTNQGHVQTVSYEQGGA